MRKLTNRVVLPTVVERVSCKDGGERTELSITTPLGDRTGLEATAQQNPVVIWNGFFGSRGLHAACAHRLARLTGRPIVTYDDPKGCYDVGAKAERAAAVTRAVTVHRPATAVLYSQAATKFVQTGRKLIADERVNAFSLLAPAGIVPQPEIPPDFGEVSWRIQRQVSQRMLSEAATIPGMVRSKRGARAAATLLVNAARCGLQWRSMATEAHSTLASNAVETVETYAGLSKIVPAGAIGFTHDRYFPAAEMTVSLVKGGFSGEIAVWQGSHVTPLFHAPTAAKIGAFIQNLGAPQAS